MPKESYNDLVFALGDLAREHLADAKNPPRTMAAVFDAEDAVLAVRQEIEHFEEELNTEDGSWHDFLAGQEEEKDKQKAIIARWKSAVIGVEGRSRDMKKKLSSLKSAHRYMKDSLRRAEASYKEMELREGHDVKKLNLTRENLKKQRLHIMRDARGLEELEWELNSVLTPRPGQQGAQGILAHKRILEMEDEFEEREHNHKEKMKELDAAIGAKEEELKGVEEELDGCIFDLGEECYADRVAHQALNPMYPKIDKAQ
jgi:hypothetical protein